MKAEFTLQQIRDFDKKGYRSIAARMIRSLLIHYKNKPISSNVKDHRREPFECPYDLKSCSHVDMSTCTLDIRCEDCERYGMGVRPSKF